MHSPAHRPPSAIPLPPTRLEPLFDTRAAQILGKRGVFLQAPQNLPASRANPAASAAGSRAGRRVGASHRYTRERSFEGLRRRVGLRDHASDPPSQPDPALLVTVGRARLVGRGQAPSYARSTVR
jgi:hypothetical protein